MSRILIRFPTPDTDAALDSGCHSGSSFQIPIQTLIRFFVPVYDLALAYLVDLDHVQLVPLNNVVRANNASYHVIRVGEIERTIANGGVVILKNVLYVAGIKKNLILVPLIAKVGLHIHFVDDKCMVHGFSDGDVIMMSSTLCNFLYRLDTYKRAALNALVVHTSSMAEMELLAYSFWSLELQ